MSARTSSPPLGIAVIVAVTVAVVAAAIADSLLGYLNNMTVATTGAWWIPVLTIGMPVLVVFAFAIYFYVTK